MDAADHAVKPTEALRNWGRYQLPAVIAIVWIALDLLLLAFSFQTNRELPSDWWLGAVLGVLFAQLSYGGLWVACGPGNVSLRLPLSLGGGALAVAAFLRHCVLRDELTIFFVLFFVVMFALFQFLLIVGCFLTAQRFRFRIEWPATNSVATGYQFGVRDLLIWMACVGIMLTIARWAFGSVSFNSDANEHLASDIFLSIALLAASLMQVFVAAYACFSSEKPAVWLTSFAWSLFFAALGAVPLGNSWTNYFVVCELLLLQHACLWCCLLVLRLAGLHLTLAEDVSSPQADR